MDEQDGVDVQAIHLGGEFGIAVHIRAEKIGSMEKDRAWGGKGVGYQYFGITPDFQAGGVDKAGPEADIIGQGIKDGKIDIAVHVYDQYR